jgi:hypothetical protein
LRLIHPTTHPPVTIFSIDKALRIFFKNLFFFIYSSSPFHIFLFLLICLAILYETYEITTAPPSPPTTIPTQAPFPLLGTGFGGVGPGVGVGVGSSIKLLIDFCTLDQYALP